MSANGLAGLTSDELFKRWADQNGKIEQAVRACADSIDQNQRDPIHWEMAKKLNAELQEIWDEIDSRS